VFDFIANRRKAIREKDCIEQRYFARLHELVGFLVCLFSSGILYFVYDLIINNNNLKNHFPDRQR